MLDRGPEGDRRVSPTDWERFNREEPFIGLIVGTVGILYKLANIPFSLLKALLWRHGRDKTLADMCQDEVITFPPSKN